ncbi:MAG: MurR/RpiR family transcriptional regulator [Oscillospiraceae bacterium]|nr:MurR/RpiR family transcriptional regulator [Oscillospiraceae bacterium]
MTKDILAEIKALMPTFSKGQRRIANYIINSYDKAAFMTANKLGLKVEVSESTVVRFATELGYEGYPAMQRALQEMVRNRLTALQRIEVSNNRMADQDIPTMVMHADAENIRLTLDGLNREAFEQTVEAIVTARKVYIVGVRSASALSDFLGFYLNMAMENVVVVHVNSFSELFEQIIHIGEGDVLVGISFPRYSKRTVKGMRYAKDQGATTIAITDSEASPLAELADHTLMARSDMISFVDSLVAPLSLVNALIMAVSRRKDGELVDTFNKLEKIWDEYEVYEKTTE